MKDLLTKNEYSVLSKIEDDFLKKLLFILILLAKQNKGFIIESKVEVLKILGLGIIRNNDLYDTCILWLIENNIISIVDGYLFIKIDDYNDISKEDIEDADIYYQFYFCDSKIKECLYCNRPFVVTANNQKYCMNHRGYIKTGVIIKKCCDCGNEFEIDSRCGNKIRCDDCQAIKRRNDNRLSARKRRMNNRF